MGILLAGIPENKDLVKSILKTAPMQPPGETLEILIVEIRRMRSPVIISKQPVSVMLLEP